MNWVKWRKLSAIEAIQYNNRSCIKLPDLWSALHSSFNSAQCWQVDVSLLNEIPTKETSLWNTFSKTEILQAIKKCNNSSAPGPDKLSWWHIKMILKDNKFIIKLIDIANVCMDLGHWPNHFKISTMIIISKPNKQAYNTLKSFWPIVLLNTLGKLFEKMIGERLQFHSISNNFVHQCQLGRLQHRSTIDVEITLTYFIRSG